MQKGILAYLIPMLINFDEPLVVMMMGLPGSGKSHIARLLEKANGYKVLSTDIIRREIGRKGDYSAEAINSVYAKLVEDSVRLLKNGVSVILDATFSKRTYRLLCYERLISYPIHIFECRVHSEETIINRIRRRVSKNNSSSEADIDVYKLQKKRYEPVCYDELRHIQSETVLFND